MMTTQFSKKSAENCTVLQKTLMTIKAYLNKYFPQSFFRKVMLFFLQRTEMLSKRSPFYELHNYIQSIICIKKKQEEGNRNSNSIQTFRKPVLESKFSNAGAGHILKSWKWPKTWIPLALDGVGHGGHPESSSHLSWLQAPSYHKSMWANISIFYVCQDVGWLGGHPREKVMV